MTVYRIANDQDLEAAADFVGRDDFGFPTIVGVRDEKIVGVISTRSRDDLVEPHILMASNSIVAANLVIAYEEFLKQVGVKSFRFAADANDESFAPLVEKINQEAPGTLRLIAKEGTVKYYERAL